MDKAAVTVKSEHAIRDELLQANRFLGLHQLTWALLITLGTTLVATSLNIAWPYHFPLSILAASYALMELLFLRRRLAIHRVAKMESRNLRVRTAMEHGLFLSEVRSVDKRAKKS